MHDEAPAALPKRTSLSSKIKEIKLGKPKSNKRRVQDEVAAAEILLHDVESALGSVARRLAVFETITE